MKKTTTPMSYLCVLFTFVAVFGISAFAQKNASFAKTFEVQKNAPVSKAIDAERTQLAPFDFSDKNYETNGINSAVIVDRVNGYDQKSVIDSSPDWMFSNVRVIATRPAYDQRGSLIFLNQFGDVASSAFADDKTGGDTYEQAMLQPIHIFPSVTYPGIESQAALVEYTDDAAALNPLGVRVVLLVNYTLETITEKDHGFLKEMLANNGESLDGLPIIKTKAELMELLYRGLVSIQMRGAEEVNVPEFMIAPVIADPTNGVITPDAYLEVTRTWTGKPLPAEAQFLETFECLQSSGEYCTSN